MAQMITFRHTPMQTFEPSEPLPDMEVQVLDLYPELDDVHIEGRRVVQISIEMFVELIKGWGYEPVTPDTPVKQTLELL